MTDIAVPDAYGQLVEPATLKIERLLPGPIDRVWAFLTQSELRRRWLASGEMKLAPDAPFELVWRNDELSDPPGHRPEGFSEEHKMASRIITVVPPHRLVFTWGEGAEVSIELQALGKQVLLTLIHRRLGDRNSKLNISAGWHTHLDILAARLQEKEPGPFWDTWLELKKDYEHRIPS
ncbi:SRPBCC family protein [Agrobacterium sp. O3.4]|uniref:SRPBCC family protein n=1 Tax=Agrobacterium cucumeris TaxID=2862866 RepID=A0ABY8RHU5_9HYPH|nr:MULTISPECIES: SRPBCC family protein [Rhizobium/Agrobacterium group]MCZ7471957.1 SRPBCC family protein [Rhizobium rhizogenes]MDA5633872.1 SRPBCC family protein [Agrobacterium sp. ST15.16.024]MDF1889387.1 SRPBCC family protein [Rhizobium rhizogenes]WHO07178.1 SRPBCC family protein [Agrobacterium cucumeris]